MAVRQLRYEGDPVLDQTAKPVSDFGTGCAALIADMLETMYDAKGRGLAAPQIGESQRIFVMDADWKSGAPNPMHFINPEVTAQSPEQAEGPEGCLSIPDKLFTVQRPVWIDVAWQDQTGQHHSGRFDGFAAVCICHEIDHLDGILISSSGVVV